MLVTLMHRELRILECAEIIGEKGLSHKNLISNLQYKCSNTVNSSTRERIIPYINKTRDNVNVQKR